MRIIDEARSRCLCMAMKTVLLSVLAFLLVGCVVKYPPRVETEITWSKEGFSQQDYYKDLLEAEKHGAEVAGEPVYPPRPIIPEYVAPPIVIKYNPKGKGEEKSEAEKERENQEFNERSRISRQRDQLTEDYNRRVALAIQAVEERRTGAIESFLMSRGWTKTTKTLEVTYYANGQRESVKRFKNGKLISALSWKPDGVKCPVTKVEKGTGVVVVYGKEGTERERRSFKDGVEVFD